MNFPYMQVAQYIPDSGPGSRFAAVDTHESTRIVVPQRLRVTKSLQNWIRLQDLLLQRPRVLGIFLNSPEFVLAAKGKRPE
jgi:hypothetical protein